MRHKPESLLKPIGEHVTILDLSYKRLFKKPQKTIIKMFKAMPPSVNTLDLRWNRLGRKTTKTLVSLFRAIPPSVNSLNLSWNNLDRKIDMELERLSKNLPYVVNINAQELSEDKLAALNQYNGGRSIKPIHMALDKHLIPDLSYLVLGFLIDRTNKEFKEIVGEYPPKVYSFEEGLATIDATSLVLPQEGLSPDPKALLLLKTLNAMHDYGTFLKKSGASSKGDVAIHLAIELKHMACAFFSQEPQQRNYSAFKKEFLTQLRSKDKEMRAYRMSWETILANILIALTGVGLLFIAGQLIHSKVRHNRPLFFFQRSKTRSEEHAADVECSLDFIS